MSCLAVGWGREIDIGELRWCWCFPWPSARPTTAHSHRVGWLLGCDPGVVTHALPLAKIL